MRKVWRVGICCLFFGPVLAQTSFAQKAAKSEEIKTAKVDSIRIKGDRFLFLGDDAYYIPRDTVIAISDTTDFYVRKENLDKPQSFYDSLANKMSKNRMSKMVYDAIFVDPGKKEKVHNENLSELRFLPYEDRIISPLKYKRLDVFGTSFNDTTKYNVDFFTGSFNKFHIKTQRWVIRRNLTFRQGDYIDAQDLVDSERLLRSRSFIRDARIMIGTDDRGDSTDVVVVSRDVFPFAVSIRPNNNNRALFGITTVNLFGLGHDLEYDLIAGGGSEFFYGINNILGSYTDLTVDISDHFRKTGAGVMVDKRFLTQDTRYAGGFEVSGFKYGENAYDLATDLSSEFYYSVARYYLWLARSFPLESFDVIPGFKEIPKLIVSISGDNQNIMDKPEVRVDTNYAFHSRKVVLAEVGLSSRNYYKDKFVINYGRTEDIPTGSKISVITGYEQREFENRVYGGIKYGRGGYLAGVGYLNGYASMGAYFDGHRFEDGVFATGVDYFSPLYVFNRFRMRQFLTFGFSHAMRPTEDLYVRGQNEIGIRGLNTYFLKGTTLTNLRFESLIFTPYNIFSCRVAPFGFFDATLVGNNLNGLINTELYSAFGIGVRFTNDNLAVSTLSIRLAYYPNTPVNAEPGWWEISTNNRVQYRDFDIEAPGLVNFR